MGYREEFKDNEIACEQIDDAIEKIDCVIEDLRYYEYYPPSSDDDLFDNDSNFPSISTDVCSIFDDVDL